MGGTLATPQDTEPEANKATGSTGHWQRGQEWDGFPKFWGVSDAFAAAMTLRYQLYYCHASDLFSELSSVL